MRAIHYLSGLVFGLMVGVGAGVVAHTAGVVFLTGDSMPRGIWVRAYRVEAPLRAGDVVRFVPAAGETLQSGRPRPVLKSVAAVAGDEVVVDDALGVIVNGARQALSGRLPLSQGIEVIPEGTYQVGDREVWLLSDREARGWDSRYYGAVGVDRLSGVYRPLWTW